MKKPTETDLVRACLRLLTLRGVWAWRANSGGGLRGGRPVRGNAPGTPDILAVLPGGRLCGVECKSASGRLRESQAAWRDRAEAAGALYWVVRGVDRLDAMLKENGL